MQKQRITLALLAATVILFTSAAFIFGGSRTAIQAAPPSLKQQAADRQKAWDMTQSKKPHAHKSSGKFSPMSCKIDIHRSAQVINLSGNPPLPKQNYDSIAMTVSKEGMPYLLYGEFDQIVVSSMPLDPCAAAATHQTHLSKAYVDATSPGQITLLAIQGDTVLFRTALRTIGMFNYVTGQYS